jgi:prephenate dehydrogenase
MSPGTKIGKLVVVGVGLIGGSFALALKEAKAVGSVVGVGRGDANLRRAVELGVIDAIGAFDRATLGDADLVMVATPVGQTGAVLRALAPLLGRSTVLTDGGSTKQDVVAAARRELGAALPRFVPGHPVAGTEKSGAQAAFAALYRGRRVVLTPLAETDTRALDLVRDAWRRCGAEVLELDPARHDAILAAVSHLPHVLAYALVHQIAGDGDAAQLFGLAAGGFRDFTRIASSSPEMWRDICLANRDALLAQLDRYTGELAGVRAMLERSDARALESLFARSRDARERWLKAEPGGK